MKLCSEIEEEFVSGNNEIAVIIHSLVRSPFGRLAGTSPLIVSVFSFCPCPEPKFGKSGALVCQEKVFVKNTQPFLASHSLSKAEKRYILSISNRFVP